VNERDIIKWGGNHEILKSNMIFYDNYQNFAYGWLSFSFKYKHISNLFNFYKNTLFDQTSNYL
jgi:hypothetical protein